MIGKRLKATDAKQYLEDIQNFENEGGMIYPPKEEPMLPYSPPWACPQWGQHEHDWLDCVECQANYEIYLEEHEKKT